MRVDIEQHLSDLITLTNKKLKKGNVLSKKLLATAIACTALLTGCLIPESFKAKADFAANGDYTFSYDGTAVHAMAAAEEKKTGSLRAKDEEGLKAEATKMKNDSMVQSAEYLGHGRYQLKLLAKKKAGENLKMMDIFSVTDLPDFFGPS